MADELTDEQFFGASQTATQPKELSDQEFLGAQQSVIQPSQTQPSQSREATRPTVSLPNLTDVLFGGGGQYVRNAQEVAGDIAKSIPQMVEQLPEMAYQGFQLAHGTPQETAQVIAQVATQGKQQADQIVSDVQSPLGSRESFRGIANLGMLALPAVGEFARPALSEALWPRTVEKPPIQTAVPEGPPIQTEPLIETAATKAEQLAKTGGEPNAVQPSNAQIQAGETPLGIEARPEGGVPRPGDSNYVERTAQGTEAGGALPRQGAEAQPEAPQTPVAPPPTTSEQIAEPIYRQSYKGAPVETMIADSAHATEQAADARLNQLDPNEDAWIRKKGDQYVVYRDERAVTEDRTNVLSDIQNGNPIPKDAITTHRLEVPEGYVAQGDQYVYKPEILEGAMAKVNFTTSKGEQVTREMNAREAEGIFTKERSSYQALLDCLGR